MQDQTIPVGLCGCGCGRRTRLAQRTRSDIGHVKGQPLRFLQGHAGGWPARRMTLAERFWEKVDRAGPDDCWLWTGPPRTPLGYGSIGVADRTRIASRVSWELHVGVIPDGLCVLHTCDNPPCVNPAHLFLGTHANNAADRDAKGRGPIGETNGSAKLTEVEVREIRTLVASGTTRAEAARRYGINRPAVSKIVARKRWAHVI